MTPGDLYRTCKVSAHRLETLQHYDVPGDEARQSAFHGGRPLPPPGEGKAADLELIRQLRAAGRSIGRVHVVVEPLLPYIRYELAVYAENIAAGEDVHIADVSEHPELADLSTDFAIFDAETEAPHLILFDYSVEGRVLGYQHIQKPEEVDRHWRLYQFAAERSVDLSTFIGTRNQPLAG